MTFQVVDLDLNSDPGVAESTTLYVTSSTETDPEPIVVTETGANTSTFAGSIATGIGAPVTDGVLQIQDGDTLTVTYRDADDGTGRPAINFDSAVADCVGPVIRNIQIAEVRDDRFTVNWDTNEPTDTFIEWGTTPALGTVISSGSLVTTHGALLKPIDLCGEAFVRITATDTHGNTTVADLNGQPFSALSYDIPGLYYRESFESDNGDWTLTGEFEIGTPQGLGGSSGPSDPAEAYHRSGALGNDLSGQGSFSGDYEPVANESARSPSLDGTSWTDTKLIFRRQLHVHETDSAGINLFFNGHRSDAVLQPGSDLLGEQLPDDHLRPGAVPRRRVRRRPRVQPRRRRRDPVLGLDRRRHHLQERQPAGLRRLRRLHPGACLRWCRLRTGQ